MFYNAKCKKLGIFPMVRKVGCESFFAIRQNNQNKNKKSVQIKFVAKIKVKLKNFTVKNNRPKQKSLKHSKYQ